MDVSVRVSVAPASPQPTPQRYFSIPCGIILIVIGWKDRNQQRNCWRVVKGKRLASGTVRGLEIHGLYVWIFCVKEKKIFLDFTIHLASLKLFTKKMASFMLFICSYRTCWKIESAEPKGRRTLGGVTWKQAGRLLAAPRLAVGAGAGEGGGRRPGPGLEPCARPGWHAEMRAPADVSGKKKTQRTPAGPAWRSLSVGAP